MQIREQTVDIDEANTPQRPAPPEDYGFHRRVGAKNEIVEAGPAKPGNRAATAHLGEPHKFRSCYRGRDGKGLALCLVE